MIESASSFKLSQINYKISVAPELPGASDPENIITET